ncbi:MAG: peptidylprolyl isomerase [candidate division Zixibacteria bacterium]|nr:peptidylprolyl isomerase [candidate division Zixibacteria bacterium]
MRKTLSILLSTFVVITFIASCAQTEEGTKEETKKESVVADKLIPPTEPYVMDENPHLVIETELGEMVVELYLKESPMTASNFLYLVNQEFYNGLMWHRVIPGFVIQGGDPQGTGMGGPGYMIDFEENDMKHEPGAMAMARSRDPNSAGSQFYIALKELPQLDAGGYCVFGKLVSGLDVAQKIAAVERNNRDKPLEDVHIIKIYEKKSFTD